MAQLQCKTAIRRRPRSVAGFTLVEMLIVIAIITILAGILFPVFAEAREKARQSACLSNERQIGVAIQLYCQDFDESLPSGCAWQNGRGWAGQAFPYVKSVGLVRCPDDATGPDKGDPGLLISYALNCNTAGKPLAAFDSPAQTVLLFEVNDSFADIRRMESASPTGRGLPTDNCPECGKPFGADYYATGNLGSVAQPLSTTRRPYHDPMSNYVAADGHVKSLHGNTVSPGFDAPSPDSMQNGPMNHAAGTECMSISPGARATLTFSLR